MQFRQWRNTYSRSAIVSADEIEALHLASLDILERIGVRFNEPEALDYFRRAGARVDAADNRVRIGRDIVAAAIRTLPERFAFTTYNPARSVSIGGDDLAVTTVLGPPYCTDLDRGRRNGSLADFSDFLRLAQVFNAVHMIGWPVEAVEVEVPVRHLVQTEAMLRLSDKVPYVFCQSRQRIHDVLDMIAIAKGTTRDGLVGDPSTYSIINTNTPLTYDTPMASGVIEMARHGQPTLITPFTLAGATTPVSVAAAITLCNAEILAGATLAQLVRPGAPVVYGGAVTSVDMKTGAPAYASPEYLKAASITGALARRYKMPFRSSNFCVSNAPDAQAAFESMGALMAALAGGANILMHGTGWLEGGLCASFEKFVLDVEMLQMLAAYLEPLAVTPEKLAAAVEEIAAVGPGGHFFGTPETIAAYEGAFYHPLLGSTLNHGAWLEAGGKDATRRANASLEAGARRVPRTAARTRAARGNGGVRRPAKRAGRRGDHLNRFSSERIFVLFQRTFG